MQPDPGRFDFADRILDAILLVNSPGKKSVQRSAFIAAHDRRPIRLVDSGPDVFYLNLVDPLVSMGPHQTANPQPQVPERGFSQVLTFLDRHKLIERLSKFSLCECRFPCLDEVLHALDQRITSALEPEKCRLRVSKLIHRQARRLHCEHQRGVDTLYLQLLLSSERLCVELVVLPN